MWPESTVIMGSDIESVACRRGQTVLICMRWDELDELQFRRTIPLFSRLEPPISSNHSSILSSRSCQQDWTICDQKLGAEILNDNNVGLA